MYSRSGPTHAALPLREPDRGRSVAVSGRPNFRAGGPHVLLVLKELHQVSSAMKNSRHICSGFRDSIEDEVIANRQAAKPGC